MSFAQQLLVPAYLTVTGVAVDSFTYVLDDQFLTNEAAPLTDPRTADPGGEILNLTDTGAIMSVSGGEMIPSSQTTGGNDPEIENNVAIGRAAGLCFKAKIKRVSTFGGLSVNVTLGVAPTSAATFTAQEHGFFMNNGDLEMRTTGGFIVKLGTVVSDVYYEMYMILKENGGVYYVLDGKLFFIQYVGSSATLFFSALNAAGSRMCYALEFFKAAQITSGNWITERGISTDFESGTPTSSFDFNCDADCLVDMTLATLPTTTSSLEIRRTDASNSIKLLISSAGALTLIRRVGGVDTTIGSGISVIAGDRLWIIANGSRLEVVTSNADQISATESTHQTVQNGRYTNDGVNGLATDLTSWPVVLSGSDLATLEAI